MNLKIKECRKEFDEGNFDKVLEIIDSMSSDDEDYNFALMLKFSCFMNLKRFDDALMIINVLIEENPYSVLLWSSKVKCHYFNDENEKAASAITHLERIIDMNDVEEITQLASLFNLIRDFQKAVEYCDKALSVDENYVPALREKALASNFMDDNDLMNECADRLLDLCGNDFVNMMFPFLIKLFSGRYDECLDIVKGIDDLDNEHEEMLKVIIYDRMAEDLEIQIMVAGDVEATIDESLEVLLNYCHNGVESGELGGVKYIIIKQHQCTN